METKIWVVDNHEDKSQFYPQISQAAQLLRANEIVAFPTETVYGLGANAKETAAVEKIFQAKGRPNDNPLIVHIAELEQLQEITKHIPNFAYKLIEHFWPGPLTLVLKKKGILSERVTAGLSTVAVRMPNHPIALELIKECGLPLAAPSANLSGRPSPTTAKHVFDDLNGRIAGIIDGGETGVGVESTVLDCTEDIPVILRPGGVTKEEIERVIGKIYMDAALRDQAKAPKSPGMKYTHYAPKSPLIIVKGGRGFLQHLVSEKRKEGVKVGVLTTEENEAFYEADIVIACGRRSELHTVASQLYQALRQFDETDVDIIYSESFPTEGIGEAVMNRLQKAAGYQTVVEK